MAPGDSPPWACGAGAIFSSESIMSRRGRACRATSVALRQAVWSGGVTYVLLKLVSAFVPLRVSLQQELEGLDISQHGEALQ